MSRDREIRLPLSISRVVILFFLLGISSQVSGVEHRQKKELQHALEEMIAVTKEPFLIVEVLGTTQFIQFFKEGTGLVLDLPTSALSKSEIEKAELYFITHKVTKSEQVGIDPAMDQEFKLTTWNKVFGADELELVADISLGALQAIYQTVPSTELTIIKGWE